MTLSLRLLTIFSLCLAVLGCAVSPIKNTEGQTAYTQINLWVEGSEHLTTNYRAGWLLPVNSQVRVLNTSADAIDLQVVESGRNFTVANVAKYTKQDIAGIYQQYFSPNPVSLSSFSPAEVGAIRDGAVVRGMRKQAVLVSRGYPPAHATGSTDADSWKYWVNRFNTRIISFDNGRVSAIKD